MGIIDKKEIRDAYKKEAVSLVNKIKKGLFSLNELQTTNNKLQLFRLFRYAHTLKGISGTCGKYKIEAEANKLENIFRAAKDEKLEISPKDKLLIKKSLNLCEKLLKGEIETVMKTKSEYTGKVDRKLIIDTNCRLQETTQKLFMAKKELQKKNKELEVAREKEYEQKEQLKHELKGLKRLAAARVEPVEPAPGKKLTRAIAEDLSLRYIQLLRTYLDTKSLDKEEPLVEELCQRLIEYGVTPRGIINIHLKSVSQVKTIGDLETKGAAFESRMSLLAVMTKYAMILKEHTDRNTDTHG